MQELLQRLLEPHVYDHLECDGQTSVLSYVLYTNQIHHSCFRGCVTFDGKTFPIHFWIECDRFIIDFKLRKWFNSDDFLATQYKSSIEAPEGVFVLPSNLQYDGQKIPTCTSKSIHDILMVKPRF